MNKPEESPQGLAPSSGDSSTGKSAKKVARRPTGYWNEFNNWYRDELDRGQRPSVVLVENWYKANAARVWPDEQDRPSSKDARLHAKSLRSTNEVKLYFQRYRAGKKERQVGGSSDLLTKRTSAPAPSQHMVKDDQEEEYLASLLFQHNSSLARMQLASTPGFPLCTPLSNQGPTSGSQFDDMLLHRQSQQIAFSSDGTMPPGWTSSGGADMPPHRRSACPTTSMDVEVENLIQLSMQEQVGNHQQAMEFGAGTLQPREHPFALYGKQVGSHMSMKQEQNVTPPIFQNTLAGSLTTGRTETTMPSAPPGSFRSLDSHHHQMMGPMADPDASRIMGNAAYHPHSPVPDNCNSPVQSSFNQDAIAPLNPARQNMIGLETCPQMAVRHDNTMHNFSPLLEVNNSMHVQSSGNISHLAPADSGERELPQLETLLAVSKPDAGHDATAGAANTADRAQAPSMPSWLPSLGAPPSNQPGWVPSLPGSGSMAPPAERHTERSSAPSRMPRSLMPLGEPVDGHYQSQSLATRSSAPQRKLYYEHLFNPSNESKIPEEQNSCETHSSMPHQLSHRISLPTTLSAPTHEDNYANLPDLLGPRCQPVAKGSQLMAPCASPFSSRLTFGPLQEQLQQPVVQRCRSKGLLPNQQFGDMTTQQLSALAEEPMDPSEFRPVAGHAGQLPHLMSNYPFNRSGSFPQSNPKRRRSEQMIHMDGTFPNQHHLEQQGHEDSLNLLQLQETLPDWPALHYQQNAAMRPSWGSPSHELDNPPYHPPSGELRSTSSPGFVTSSTFNTDGDMDRSSAPARVMQARLSRMARTASPVSSPNDM